MIKYKHILGMADDNPFENPKTAQKAIKLPTLPAASQDVAATANLANLYYDSTGNAVMAQINGAWTALSTTAAVGSLDQVCAVGASTNEESVTFTGSAASATAFRVGGAAANDKVVIYHDATNAHINTLAGDLHLEPAGADVYITGDCYVSADVQVTGAVVGATANILGATVLGSCSVLGALSAGSFSMDAVAASTAGATLTLDGNAAGGVNLCSISTGGITMSDDANVVAGKTLTLAGAVHSDVLLVSLGDIALADGRISITDNDNAASFVLTNDTFTNGASGLIDINAGGAISGNIISVVANDVSTGTMLYLETSAAGPFAGKYIQCYDGAADDFSVGLYGATIIAGNAAGTAALTVSAGDLKLTAGVIDQDCVTDVCNVFTRAQATTTKDFVQILCTDASDDHSALYVKHDGTAGIPAVEIVSAGSDSALVCTTSAAAGSALTLVNTAAGTDSILKVDGETGTWVGAANVGMVNVVSDGTPADVAASCLRIGLSGAGILLGEGNCLRVVDTSVAATSHSVYISSTNNEALWVDVGKARFDEGVLVGSGATGYVSSLGAQDLVLRTNEGTDSGTITIADGTNGGITIDCNGTGRLRVPSTAVHATAATYHTPFIIRQNFSHADPDANNDITITTATPKMHIIDAWVDMTTAEGGAMTITLRKAAAGAGDVISSAMDANATGLARTTTLGVGAVCAANDDIFANFSGNPGTAAGVVYIACIEVE